VIVVPRDDGTHRTGQWETIYHAIGDTARTVRLCAIILTIAIATAIPFLILALARRWLG
jgi:hypothetical protein